jgi:hypothetical protein
MSDQEGRSGLELTRRELLKLAGGAAAMAPLAGAAAAVPVSASAATTVPAAAPLFFTAAEFRLLDELTELIIPTDEHSPGARAAEVPKYIDARLAEYDPAMPDLKQAREQWKAGLASVDALSKEMHGAGILDVPEEKRNAVLERISKTEKPETPAEQFFGELKSWTARGYYTSKIGIHQEMEYKGNTLQTEYAGIDAGSV